jgi:hypothetical protein
MDRIDRMKEGQREKGKGKSEDERGKRKKGR